MDRVVCSSHPDIPALFRCEGCQQALCRDCVDEGHALLFCKLCREQAIPLDSSAPATVGELRRIAAVEHPYSLGFALLYPFRGTGKYVYVALLGVLFVVWFLNTVPAILSCFVALGILVISVVAAMLVAGLQMRIVRTTAEGDDELPDWPEFNGGQLWRDLLTWIVVYLMQFGPAVLLVVVVGWRVLVREPNPLFWLAFAACLWFGSGLATVAFGAAAHIGRLRVFSVLGHLEAFAAAGSDAVMVTNLVFGVGGLVLVLRTWLSATMPWLGGLLSGLLAAYWILTQPHLAGVLARRHNRRFEAIYGPYI